MKKTEHTFYKDKCFNFQLVRFEKNSTLLNIIKSYTKSKKHYDVIIIYCSVQIFSAKIHLSSEQTPEIHKISI